MKTTDSFILLNCICFFCFPAAGIVQASPSKPEVIIVPVKTNIRFFSEHEIENCGKDAAGCVTSFFKKGVYVDCHSNKITLEFGYIEHHVHISDRFEKGTLEFDNVLKHELTHINLYQGVVKRFYEPVALACLLSYEKSYKQGKKCGEIRGDVKRTFDEYIKKLHEESTRQNNLIDGKENYQYQWEQVRRYVKEKAQVDIALLNTERRYDVSPAENIVSDKDGNFVSDGNFILKKLSTGVFLELNRFKQDVDCRTGKIKVSTGFLTTIAFNEREGTYLYDYLKSNLERRAGLLEEERMNMIDMIKKDIEKSYERLAKDGSDCYRIRSELSEKLPQYQQMISEQIRKKNQALGNPIPLWRDCFEKDLRANLVLVKKNEEPEKKQVFAHEVLSRTDEIKLSRKGKEMQNSSFFYESLKHLAQKHLQRLKEPVTDQKKQTRQENNTGILDYLFKKKKDTTVFKEKIVNSLEQILDKIIRFVFGTDQVQEKKKKEAQDLK